MQRSHDWNSYEDHIRLLYLHIDNYAAYFDETAEQQEHHCAATLIDANMVHEAKTDPSFLVPRIFFGVHVLRIGSEYVKVSWQKNLALRKLNDRIESRTESYSYNLSWEEKRTGVSRILRFDNKDDNYGFETAHHFHCIVHPPNDNPQPFHIGEHFPHLSDIFNLALWAAREGFKSKHDLILKKARALRSKKSRSLSSTWLNELRPLLSEDFR